MISPRPARRLTALIAAYAIALQVFLPAALAIVATADYPICTAQAEGDTGIPGPGHHGDGTGDCCGVLCQSSLLFTPPQPAVLALPAPVTVATGSLVELRFVPAHHRGPQSPRAPPAA